jgi:hypothetical protein
MAQTNVPASQSLLESSLTAEDVAQLLGRGYCSLDGGFRNWGVEGEGVVPVPTDDLSFSLIEIADFQQVLRSMSLSANAQFADFSGSAVARGALDIAQSTRYETFSLFVMVKVNIVTRVDVLKTPKLTKEAQSAHSTTAS